MSYRPYIDKKQWVAICVACEEADMSYDDLLEYAINSYIKDLVKRGKVSHNASDALIGTYDEYDFYDDYGVVCI